MKVIGPIIGFLLVVATIATGFIHIAQWIVLILGALFTVAYISGKWVIWQELVESRDRKFYQSLLATYVVETLIVFALYWLGRGVADLNLIG
ncbi:MAG: hypothetical protein AB8B99_11650 [Phormidesmis sp.]